MPIHLENQQQVTFNQNDEITDLIQKNEETQFTAWFKSNQKFPQYRHILYKNYPQYFSYNKSLKTWKKRNLKNDIPKEIVTRIYDVSMKDKELFYLKSVLDYIPGATSYKDLKTVNGIECDTYYEVLKNLGVIEDDDEWIKTLEEGILTLQTKLCRQLFAYLIIYCSLENPKDLWTRFREKLCDDLIRKYSETLTIDEIYKLALSDVNAILQENGMSLNNFGFEIVESSEIENLLNRSLANEEIVQFENNLDKMTSEQRNIYETILESVSSDQIENGKVYFIDAPGGTGKSFTLNLLIQKSILDGFKPIAVASSGIAALLLKGGKTAHYTFKIPLEVDEHSTCSFKEQSETAKMIKESKIIIWDEAPMSKKFTIEAVEKSIRNLTKNEIIFGGKVVVFSGDFRQTLPVVTFGHQEEAVDLSIKRSYIWSQIKIKNLTKNLRIRNQDFESIKFAEFLLKLGEGKLEKDEENTVEIPNELFSTKNNLIEFIKEVFILDDNLNFEHQAILAPKNEDANEINNLILEEFYKEKETFTSLSKDSMEEKDNQFELPEEFLNTLEPPGLPPHRLELKEECIVMLLRNMYPKRGFCNGTRCKVINIAQNYLTIEIISGQFKGERTALPKIILQPTMNRRSPFNFRRKQFPIKLGFAMTINKSQGQTYERVGIYLREQVFSHGQLYVSLSRCVNHKNIKIYSETDRLKNIVFKQIFD